MIKTYFNTELSAKCVQQRFTSSVFVAKVWESPDVSQTNNVSSYSQDELNLTAPLFSLFRLGLCMSGCAPKVHRINLSLLHFNLEQENKSVSVTPRHEAVIGPFRLVFSDSVNSYPGFSLILSGFTQHTMN